MYSFDIGAMPQAREAVRARRHRRRGRAARRRGAGRRARRSSRSARACSSFRAAGRRAATAACCRRRAHRRRPLGLAPEVLSVDAENLTVRVAGRRDLGEDRPRDRHAGPGAAACTRRRIRARRSPAGSPRAAAASAATSTGRSRRTSSAARVVLPTGEVQGVHRRRAARPRRRCRGNHRHHHRGRVPRPRRSRTEVHRLVAFDDAAQLGAALVGRLGAGASDLVDHVPEPRVDAAQEAAAAPPRPPVRRWRTSTTSPKLPEAYLAVDRLPGVASRRDRRGARGDHRGATAARSSTPRPPSTSGSSASRRCG